MRILLLCEGDAETRNSWSGISKSVVDHLRKRGHTVSTGNVDLSGLTRWATIARTWSPDRFRWWARYHLTGLPFELRSRRAARIIRAHRGRVDLILQFGATFEPRGREGIPYAIYCDGNARFAERGDPGGQAEVGGLSASELSEVVARESRIYAEAGRIFTFSEPLTRSFVEDFEVPPGRVRTIHAGPNLDPTAISAPREQPQGAQRTVLFVGRSFKRKGGDLLLDAFRRVREVHPDTKLVIVGPTKPPPPQEGVEFLGFLRKEHSEENARLARAYAEADVFCLPTRYEPFGVVFLEAMLHGVPCVGPDAWAVPEMIVDGETGLLVEPESVDSLTAALCRLLESSGEARRMGLAGRQRALDHFLWDKVVGRMDAGLQEMMGELP